MNKKNNPLFSHCLPEVPKAILRCQGHVQVIQDAQHMERRGKHKALQELRRVRLPHRAKRYWSKAGYMLIYGHMCIYIYICVCVCVYIYIYILMYGHYFQWIWTISYMPCMKYMYRHLGDL